MKLYVLFIKHKGEECPEAQAVADEYTMEVNPDYMQEKIDEVSKWSHIESHALVVINVPDKPIDDALNPKMVEVNGEVVKD
jgi:hypothetical protein